MSDDAETLIRHHAVLWGEQANFRSLWNTIAQFVMPAWDNFLGDLSEGINRSSRIFDSTAVTANERFAAAMEQMLTPRTQVWHKLVPIDEQLADNGEVQAYLDEVNKILFAARYRPTANYASQADECYLSLGAFGNAAMFVDEVVGVGLRYRAIPMNEVVWALNHSGMVDTLYRKFKWTAKQAIQQWGDKVSDQIRKAYEQNPYTELEFLHCVKPNEERKPGMMGPKGMKFASWYISLKDKAVIEAGGYRVFPYGIGRYRMAPREHYGRSPATVALPHIRTLNEMKKTALRAGQKAVDPPILLAEEGVLTPFNQRPGAVNYGMLTADGQALAQPMQSGAKFDIGQELMQLEAGAINDAFLTSLFQILVQNPTMTATEALIRAQEKGALIAPAMGRQQSEFLGPQIIREIDLLTHAGQLPPAPDVLMQSGDGIKIEYTSPLTRAMRAEEGTAIMNTVQAIGVMAQIDKSVINVLDFTEAAREMALINGTPAKLLRSEEQIDEILQAQQQQNQEAAMVKAAPGVSQSALNLAKAAQAGAAAGQPGAAAAA